MIGVEITSDSMPAINMLNNIEHSFHVGMRQGWFKAGDELSKELSEQVLKKPRSGRTYVTRIRGGNRRRHRASKAGESPANRSGNYRRSRGYNIRGWNQLEFGIKNVKYAKFLEQGTKNMDPRPGVKNAVEAKQNQIQGILESSLRNQFIT